MRNGWRCWASRRVMVPAIVLALSGAAVLWWRSQPHTPEALFRARCSACHELRAGRVCGFAPALRPAIVDTMRRLHGAAEVIDGAEAAIIKRYLSEELPCP